MVRSRGLLSVIVLLVVRDSRANGSPSIELTLTSPPVLHSDISFRCTTQHVELATVEFYLNDDPVARVVHPCGISLLASRMGLTCSKDGTKLLYTLTIASFDTPDIGLWTCRNYVGSSSYNITTRYMTSHVGYVLRRIGEDASLHWPPMLPGIQPQAGLFDPGGSSLMVADFANGVIQWGDNLFQSIEFTGNLTQGLVSVVLRSVEKTDNGTYMIVHGHLSIGITLVVIDTPARPVITEVRRSSVSGLTVTVKGSSSSKSGAPSYYHPEIKYHWNHPDQQGYATSKDGRFLTISNVDCQGKTSLPVFCYATENASDNSPKKHYYPHSACPHETTTKTSGGEGRVDEYTLRVIGFVAAAIAVVMSVPTYIYLWRRRRGIGSTVLPECCSRMTDSCDGIGEQQRQRVVQFCGRCWKPCVNCCSLVGVVCGYTCMCCCGLCVMACTQIPVCEKFWGRCCQCFCACCKRCCCCYCGDDDDETNPDGDVVTNEPRGNINPVNFIENLEMMDTEGTSAVANREVRVLRRSVASDLESALAALRSTLTDGPVQLQIRRSDIVTDLMAYYEEPDIVGKSVTVEYTGERGYDLGGVTADMFTTFWNMAAPVYFRGHEALVPFLPPHRLGEEHNFVLLGRIYSHSTSVLGYVPVQLCRSTVMVLVYNDTKVSEDVVLEDFLSYLDELDRELILVGLNDFLSLSSEMLEKLRELFIRFEMGCVLTQDTFKSQVVNMARNELCIKPGSLCELMRRGIPDAHIESFWSQVTLDELDILYTFLKPSASKVLSKIRASRVGRLYHEEARVFSYLKDFVKSLETDRLELFLQFVTGHRTLPISPIVVEFVDLSGVQRRPIAHTCGGVLELPSTYDNYGEFQTEFLNILSSDEAMRMDLL
ncbi:hypothetical protein ScPMuIL_002961 [Solemya velum]